MVGASTGRGEKRAEAEGREGGKWWEIAMKSKWLLSFTDKDIENKYFEDEFLRVL